MVNCHKRNTTKVKIKVEETFNGVEFWGVNSVKKEAILLPPVTATVENNIHIVMYSIILYENTNIK